MPRTTRKLLCLLAFSAGMAVPALALADVPPPDSCTTDGGVCVNAGGDANQPGICSKATCAKQMPDGGTMTYDCLKCLPTDGGGTGGSGGAGTGGSGGAGTGGSGGAATGGSGGAATGGSGGSAGSASKKKSSSSGGCSLSAPGQDTGWAGLILLGGLGLLGFGRRRR